MMFSKQETDSDFLSAVVHQSVPYRSIGDLRLNIMANLGRMHRLPAKRKAALFTILDREVAVALRKRNMKIAAY